MQSELNVFVELADTWETIEGNSDQRAVYRECADGLRMMVDFKRQQIDTGLQPDRAPTHRCTVCGAFWMEWKDSWSLCSKQCGKCCDNVAMCDQIVPLIVSDIYAPAAEITRLTEALRAAEAREKALLSDAERYHWLRDHSCPPHNFYISVPVEFAGHPYAPGDVDAYIDAARQALAGAKP